METKQARVYRDDSAHRRGLVLGLTMAEIMVLILFMLLLLLAASVAHHREEIGAKQETIEKQAERIAQLNIIREQLGEVLARTSTGVTVNDIVQQITRQQEKILRLEAEVSRLTPFEGSGKSIETIIHALSRESHGEPTATQIADKISRLAELLKDNETLKGQNVQLSRQIRAAGRGNEFPSCWVTADGRVESIFELIISESGIRVIDRVPLHRTEEKNHLPLSAVLYEVELDRFEFEAAVRPLYQWSVAHQCRFYVMIASSEHSAPIHLVNAVNGYFYPNSKIQFRPGSR